MAHIINRLVSWLSCKESSNVIFQFFNNYVHKLVVIPASIFEWCKNSTSSYKTLLCLTKTAANFIKVAYCEISVAFKQYWIFFQPNPSTQDLCFHRKNNVYCLIVGKYIQNICFVLFPCRTSKTLNFFLPFSPVFKKGRVTGTEAL